MILWEAETLHHGVAPNESYARRNHGGPSAPGAARGFSSICVCSRTDSSPLFASCGPPPRAIWRGLGGTRSRILARMPALFACTRLIQSRTLLGGTGGKGRPVARLRPARPDGRFSEGANSSGGSGSEGAPGSRGGRDLARPESSTCFRKVRRGAGRDETHGPELRPLASSCPESLEASSRFSVRKH